MEEPKTDELIAEKLAEINGLIAPYQLAWVDPKTDCDLLERNARYMTKTQMETLAQNIAQDGFLSQLPFAIRREDGRYRILSGNHRIKGTVKANQKRVLLLYGDEKDYSPQRQTAVQLSHNAIVGQDDLTLLKELYSEIEDVVLKAYTGVDEKELFAYKPFEIKAISEEDIAMTTVSFTFSETGHANVDRVLERLDSLPVTSQDSVFVLGDVDEFIRTLTEIKKRLGIKSRSVAFAKMCEICNEWLMSPERGTETEEVSGETGS